MSIDRGMDKEDLVHLYNGILFSHNKEWNNSIRSNADGPRDYNKVTLREKQVSHDTPYIWNLKKNTWYKWTCLRNRNRLTDFKKERIHAYPLASLGKEMATHSSILAWRILWTEEPGQLQSMEPQRVRHDWVTEHLASSDHEPRHFPEKLWRTKKISHEKIICKWVAADVMASLHTKHCFETDLIQDVWFIASFHFYPPSLSMLFCLSVNEDDNVPYPQRSS